MVNTETQSLQDRLTKAGQSQILQFWDELTDEQKAQLESQCEKFDFADVNRIFKSSMRRAQEYAVPRIDDQQKLQPISVEHAASNSQTDAATRDKYWINGLTAISQGQLGVVVMAGGQATRLGASQPKGIIPMQLLRPRDTLLQIQASQIAKLQSLAKEKYPETEPVIHWWIMTSAATAAATQQHVKTDIVDQAILNEKQIHFICQNEMPCFTAEGKLMLKEKHVLATAPDGNGGLYSALKPELSTIEKLGIKYVHVYCVDNILCRVADPVFCGYAIDRQADCAAKVVQKTDPTEAVGVVCQVSGIPKVLEYSEIPRALSEQSDTTDPSRLAFRAGNIANHFFTTQFLQNVCAQPLPFHPASKKIPHLDSQGQSVQPATPNGVKMEQFVFDVFAHSESFYIWEVSRADEFSPLKNADSAGKDCMSTCRRDLWSLNRSWIEQAGGVVQVVDQNTACEVDPAVSYAGENLGPLVDGKTFATPVYLQQQ